MSDLVERLKNICIVKACDDYGEDDTTKAERTIEEAIDALSPVTDEEMQRVIKELEYHWPQHFKERAINLIERLARENRNLRCDLAGFDALLDNRQQRIEELEKENADLIDANSQLVIDYDEQENMYSQLLARAELAERQRDAALKCIPQITADRIRAMSEQEG